MYQFQQTKFRGFATDKTGAVQLHMRAEGPVMEGNWPYFPEPFSHSRKRHIQFVKRYIRSVMGLLDD